MSEESLQLFCQQVKNCSDHSWNIEIEPVEEIELLFEELKTRHNLTQGKYDFDPGLPRNVLRFFNVQPWLYTDIGGIWILRESGIPLLTCNWHQNLDAILLAGFFGAVHKFAENMGHELQKIILKGLRFFFQKSRLNLIFAIAVPPSLPASQALSLLSKMENIFISHYSHYLATNKDIVITSQFTEFDDLLLDLLFTSEFEVYLKTGVLRTKNPLLFQLAHSILPCTDEDLRVLRILEQNSDMVLSLQNIAKKAGMSETKTEASLQLLERRGLIRGLQEASNKIFTSNLRYSLLNWAVEHDFHHLMDTALQDFLQLIDLPLS